MGRSGLLRAAAPWIAAFAGLLSPGLAAAGLSPAQMLARHRALVAADHEAPAPAFGVGLQLGTRSSTLPALLGDPVGDGTAGVQLRQRVLPREATPLGLELRLGALAEGPETDVELDGSAIDIVAGAGLAYASIEPRHWGPGWFGSLMLDAAAAPLPAFGWRGGAHADDDGVRRWSADVFVARLQGHTQPVNPRLIGMRLEWRPDARWTVGFARTLQWGGRGRDNSARSLLDALLGRDNVGDDGITPDNEPGNQLAGVDVRHDGRAGAVDYGVYAQVVGEDEARLAPSLKMMLAGFDVGAAVRGSASWRAILEWVNTTAGAISTRVAPGAAYRHPLFAQGYTHRGRMLAHVLGGDARLASAGLLADRGPVAVIVALHRGRALDGSQRFVAGDLLRGTDLALTVALDRHAQYGLAAQRWRAGARIEHRAALWAQYSWP